MHKKRRRQSWISVAITVILIAVVAVTVSRGRWKWKDGWGAQHHYFSSITRLDNKIELHYLYLD